MNMIEGVRFVFKATRYVIEVIGLKVVFVMLSCQQPDATMAASGSADCTVTYTYELQH